MNMLTVTEFFTFIVIIVMILLVLICWKVYRFEKRQIMTPSLSALGDKLDAISGQTGNIGAIQGKLGELSSKTDSIQNIQKSVGELSENLSSVSAKADKSAGLTDSLSGLGQDMQIMLDVLSERIDGLARQVEDIKTVDQKVCDLKTDTDQMKQQIEEIRTVHLKLLSDISAKMEGIRQNISSAMPKETAASESAENMDSKMIPEQEMKADLKIPAGDAPSALQNPPETERKAEASVREAAGKSLRSEPHAPQNPAQTEQKAETPVGEAVQESSHGSKNSAENREKAKSLPEDEEEKKKQELLAKI